MDLVEIVLAIEERFGVTLRHTDAEKIRTVGDLSRTIHNYLEQARVRGPAPALAALNKLGVEVTGETEFRCQADDLVREKLSAAQRRVFWARLPEIMGYPPDPLVLSPIARGVQTVADLAIFVGGLLAAKTPTDSLGLEGESWAAILWPWACLGLAVGLIVLERRISRGFASYPSDRWRTFGEIAQRVTNASSEGLLLRDEAAVFAALVPILVATLAVDPDEVTPQARLIEDLGAD